MICGTVRTRHGPCSLPIRHPKDRIARVLDGPRLGWVPSAAGGPPQETAEPARVGDDHMADSRKRHLNHGELLQLRRWSTPTRCGSPRPRRLPRKTWHSSSLSRHRCGSSWPEPLSVRPRPIPQPTQPPATPQPPRCRPALPAWPRPCNHPAVSLNQINNLQCAASSARCAPGSAKAWSRGPERQMIK